MTVPVNLLPWREQLRQRHRRAFVRSLFATAALALAIVVLVAQHLREDIHEQQTNNALLRSELARVAASIQEIGRLQQRERDIAERLVVLQQLQEGRSNQARIFETVARAVPADVQLRALRGRGQSLEVAGIAVAHKAVAQLMRSLTSEGMRPSLHNIAAVAAEEAEMPAADAFLLTLEPAADAKAMAQPEWSE